MAARTLVSLSLAIGVAAALTGIGVSQPRVAAKPVVVELFTSQGCSSCPPADKIMEDLAVDPRVVAITRPVTYWDRLGWKDTLAKPENTALQSAYSQRKIPGAGNYTPQSVVQGRSGTVGGRGPTIQNLITQAGRIAQPSLAMTRRPGGFSIAIDGPTKADARVSIFALRRQADVAIANGENGGRKVRYSNVFMGEHDVGRWTGGAKQIDVTANTVRVSGADRYAVVVRSGDTGPILAARYI